MSKSSVLIFCLAAVITMVLGLMIERARADELFDYIPAVFPTATITLPKPVCPYFKWMQANGEPHEQYKQDLLRQYQDEWCNAGVRDPEWIKLLSAQMAQENGAMTVDRTGDNGCSLGLFQRNACANDGTTALGFLKTHPEWYDPKVQIDYMLDRMQGYLKEFGGDIELAIAAHNGPGRIRRGESDSCRYVSKKWKCYLRDEVKKVANQMVSL